MAVRPPTVPKEWADRFAQAQASVPGRVTRARRFLDAHADLLDRCRGGMHRGFFAAIAQWESDGKMGAPGDATLGEVGWYQVIPSIARLFGLDPKALATEEGNTLVAGLEYTMYALRAVKRWTRWVADGTRTQWLIARLAFAVGWGGTKKLVDPALASRAPGEVTAWRAIVEHADATGGITLGRVPAGKVWYRVRAIDVQWKIGRLVAPGASSGKAVWPTAPQGLAYRLPPEFR